MRARGAKVTDIVVLVVAADDGIQPQTIEAIAHAKAAGVPMIVAINKVDKPDADSDRVRRDLLQHDVALSRAMAATRWASTFRPRPAPASTSSRKAILLQAEILELRANPERAAQGAIVEAKLERGPRSGRDRARPEGHAQGRRHLRRRRGMGVVCAHWSTTMAARSSPQARRRRSRSSASTARRRPVTTSRSSTTTHVRAK